MTDQELIKHCKVLIESQLQWKDSREWKHRDFEYLGDLIYEKTAIRLSISTLKRIWAPNRQNMPHPGTLDALAKFADFSNWYDLKKKFSDQYQSTSEKITPALFSLSSRQWMGIAVFLFIPIAFFLLSSWNKNTSFIEPQPDISGDVVKFSSKKQSQGIPNAVIFNYDISKIPHDSAFIQQSWDKRLRQKISGKDQFYTCQYYFPGYFQAKLILNNQIVQQLPIHITTNGWQTLIQSSHNAAIPTYIPKEAVESLNQLHLKPEKVNQYLHRIENNSYWTNYYNVQDFDLVDTMGFIFETSLKNDIEQGGLTCQHAQATIIGEHGRIAIPLTAPGCVGDIRIVVGEVYLNSKNNDLSAFGCNLSGWQLLRCEAKAGKVDIYLNNNLIWNISYQKSIGKLVGLRFKFHGSGAIQFVQLKGLNEIIYFEDYFTAISEL